MGKAIPPFAEGPIREKKVLSLGFYRTGSQSLSEALTILGYKDVFHSSSIMSSPDRWLGFQEAVDHNTPCLPTYTGRDYTRAEWDAYFGPCEALTDVTPFTYPLLRAYPEAQVILVRRDFDPWAESFLHTLLLPSSAGLIPWLSGNVLEPFLGMRISATLWKFYMGLLGVCDLRKARDPRVLRAAYDRHHDVVRRMVPADRLLDLNLRDLSWEPLCAFLGKDVPNVPFPRANERDVYRDAFGTMHRMVFFGALVKGGMMLLVGGVIIMAGMWLTRFWAR